MVTREAVLKSRGYVVESVLGNDAAHSRMVALQQVDRRVGILQEIEH